jgi:hypothetical protein
LGEGADAVHQLLRMVGLEQETQCARVDCLGDEVVVEERREHRDR